MNWISCASTKATTPRRNLMSFMADQNVERLMTIAYNDK